ncbi:hypothetical protein VOLCADRAFT_120963 [Volvox carteri f. nagariensis]|uniref:Mediator of RNA polymerase II transcription subunit 28 n=1 Tax=Volvox carteri f. nagariensis TaxID=3068 RepID=D8TY57_VOLCA|nr:uncharacterized protein VOLCADRAFT_120963 [Volvox carteri f. nagariensis]EFJ47491.1 hypothetical protein VOLCADRAFT_120963 [Volvox carteri f. nagariensis]|eukprot:XP_002951315.1 hypothetical protein VOLCADRAFT_120963 [Volvox carteri f. nagariensis]
MIQLTTALNRVFPFPALLSYFQVERGLAMANPLPQRDVLGLLDKMEQAVADMLPRPNDPAGSARASEAVRNFAGAVGELEKFFRQLQELKVIPQGPAAAQALEVEELQAEIEEKDRLIAHARAQVARWQDILQQQEQLQENTLFAGMGG